MSEHFKSAGSPVMVGDTGGGGGAMTFVCVTQGTQVGRVSTRHASSPGPIHPPESTFRAAHA
jgi:hypothetical protein